ncbi:outer membrane protein assembly factor BamD [Pseudomonas neustonica]|uniref:Outer membrane protein assembly factor BamD n=2 Tax=Pseudomonas TaxID=286 RepID=A0ABX9XEZ5_9PSED|nr:outer membrane protein assembly factor BamD [Pseudomonas sp. SSM44]ROZ82313.1 outer membrane protein assembly factor BamD [Pseudomonas neustonica]
MTMLTQQHNRMGAMRGVWLLAVLLGLAGCASSTVKQQEQSSAVADARARLGMGQCNMNLAQQVHQLSDPQLDLEAAYLCLQQGQLPPLELVLEDFAKRHPDAPYQDYASYLQAMVPFARFEMAAGDDQERLRVGREAHAQLTGFIRHYPESAYRSEIVPRLETLLEGMAQAEYDLAMLDVETGQRERGEARLRYLTQYYPRSKAAVEAQHWLGTAPSSTSD